jgi:hypothetical protein
MKRKKNQTALAILKNILLAAVLIQAGPAWALSFTLKTPSPPATGYFFDWVLRSPSVVRGTPMNPSEVPAYDPPVYATAVNYNNGFYFPTNTSWQDAWYYFTEPSRGYIPMGFLRDYMGNHQYFTGHKTNTNLPPVNGSYDGIWTIAARKGWFAACMVDGAAAPLSGQQDFDTRTTTVLYSTNGATTTVVTTRETNSADSTTITTNYNGGTTSIVTIVRNTTVTQGKIDSVSLMTGIDPDTGLQISNGAPRMDFVLMDFEAGEGYQGSEKSVEDECLETVRLVKASPNAAVRSAWVGNYAYFAGRVVPGSFPWSCDYSSKGAFYRSSGMNVAQPACYPKTSYTLHTNAYYYGANICPSARASLFWACLELCSEAARNLPENHLLIPWVVAASMYPGSEANPMPYGNEVPEREDFLSLIKHYRMRGADGIANNGMYHDKMDVVPTNSWIYSYARDTYRYDILEAWNSLNAYFDPSGVKHTELLNLGIPVTVIGTNVQDAVKVPMANKVSGLEWSGVIYGNKARILVSNLNPTNSQSVSLPAGYGLPAATPSVGPNSHVTFDYTITNLLENSDFSTTGSPWWPDARDLTEGVGGSPCLARANGPYCFNYTIPCRTEPNEQMNFTISAKTSVSGSRMSVSYYCVDDQGDTISGLIGNITAPVTLQETNQTFNFQFTVTNDMRVHSIRPILYNTDYSSTNPAVLYVDDVFLKFQE